MDYVSRQDIFDSQTALNATAALILLDFTDVWMKHRETLESKGMTDAVQADYKKLATKYDVEYTTPRESTTFLKVVNREGLSLH